ncbi:hypothetical protein PFISCL1PPCAC_24839, partial [Pristionchus fissidentatus]
PNCPPPMSSLSYRSSVTIKGDTPIDSNIMSDFGGDDVRELNYESDTREEHVMEHNDDGDSIEGSEVLQESDVDGFRKTPSRNDRFSSSSFIEEERAVMVDKPYEVEVPAAHSDEEEDHKYQSPRPTKIEDIIPARDENENHSHGNGHDEDMGSAKKAFAQYEAALNKSDSQKAADDDAERAELLKKKKVSDLISRFNTGAAFNQGTNGGSTYKSDYGVGKGSGTVNTGRFK